MKNRHPAVRASERGIALIEFALIAPILLALLAFTVFFGRVFWHYTVAQKAAYDAAIVMSMASKREIELKKSGHTEPDIVGLARVVAVEELDGLNPGSGDAPTIAVQCDSLPCIGIKAPKEVSVTVRMVMVDPFFLSATQVLDTPDGLLMTAQVRLPYVGH
jgi:hypothetical protein